MTRTEFKVADQDGEDRTIQVESSGDGAFSVTVQGQGNGPIALDVQRVGPREYHVLHGDQSIGFVVDGEVPEITLYHAGEALPIEMLDERAASRLAASGTTDGRAADGTVAINAPMPGKVVKRLVEEGEEVKAGQGVIVVEAMKMENELRSTVDGRLKVFKVNEGDNVEAGECLAVIE
jgi:biotin carboxyl carrier protein